MKFRFIKFVAVAITTSLLLTACGKKEDPNAAQAMKPMPVTTLTMVATSVPIQVEAVAQTEGAKEVEIRPRVGGILLKRLYEEGMPVKEGQALFTIDPMPFQIALAQAKAALEQQKAKIEQTAREADRLKNLLVSQSVSQRDYDNAVSDNALAKATLLESQAKVREAELNLSYTTVTSPVSGVSGRFQFSEGALVQANTSLLTTVVQLSPIWVRFSFSESELQSLGGHLSETSVKNISLMLPDGSEYHEKGKLNFIASQIDPSLGTQQLRATFKNADQKLLPGQFVRARVSTGEKDGVFLVPQVALMTTDQGKVVFTVNQNNEVAPRPVETGGWSGQSWVVLKGLNAGDKVIIDNIIKLRPGAKVEPKEKPEPQDMANAPAPAAK